MDYFINNIPKQLEQRTISNKSNVNVCVRDLRNIATFWGGNKHNKPFQEVKQKYDLTLQTEVVGATGFVMQSEVSHPIISERM